MSNRDGIKEMDSEQISKGKGNSDLNQSLNSLDEYKPIQKNGKLLKFILYTTKVEIKSNNFMKMVFSSSILELMLWTISLLIFFAAPSDLWFTWILIPHVGRGILGIILINNFPKTYEILDNLAKNPDFEEEKIMDMVQQNLRDTFSERFAENRTKLVIYLAFTCVCLIIDFVLFWVQVFVNMNAHGLLKISLLFIIIVLLGKIFFNLLT